MVQIGIDYGGWPVDALTLREILKNLGFKDDGDKVYIEKDNPILYAYPRLLEDDGAGYGVNAEYVTEADKEIYDVKIKTIDYEVGDDPKLDITTKTQTETINVFNLFRDVPHNKLDEDDE